MYIFNTNPILNQRYIWISSNYPRAIASWKYDIEEFEIFSNLFQRAAAFYNLLTRHPCLWYNCIFDALRGL